MSPAILLVDDQHDVLTLLHSVLDTLKQPELEILEALSGEEALSEASRHHLDVMVLDYRLPGMTGIDVMHKVRAGQPDVNVILISGVADPKARADMRNAGAAAVFDKPIPLADFLDVVERSLGLTRTIFPGEPEAAAETGPVRVSELVANFRQDVRANAVFLINDRGLVVARAGDLRDRSMEVSLVSALTATANAGLKVARSNRQDSADQFSFFAGGDHDLILMPIDASYSLLLAGEGLSSGGTLLDMISAMQAVRAKLAESLRAIGAPHDRNPTLPIHRKAGESIESASASTAPEIEALLKDADAQKLEAQDLDAFWDEAAAQHANKPNSPDVIPYEEARKLGLTPDDK